MLRVMLVPNVSLSHCTRSKRSFVYKSRMMVVAMILPRRVWGWGHWECVNVRQRLEELSLLFLSLGGEQRLRLYCHEWGGLMVSETTSSQQPIRVLLADDHDILRQGLTLLLSLQPEIQV